MNKSIILIFISIFLFNISFSQNNLKEIDETLKENIRFFTDREIYLTGEKIWFSSLITDNDTTSSIQISNILYVELNNSENKSIKKWKFKINKRLVNGFLNIPTDIISGNYYLRIYTGFLRNYKPHNFTYKTLKIINPLISLPEENDSVFNTKFEFFPESGSIIPETKNNVTLRINKALLDEINSIDIINSNDSIINQCTIYDTGLAFFTYTPKTGEKYYLKQNYNNGKVIFSSFPELKRKEISIQSFTDENNLELYVSSENFKLNNNTYHIEIKDINNVVLYNNDFTFKNSIYKATVKKEKLTSGINIILIKDNKNNIKNFTIKYIQKSKPQEIEIITDKKIYSPKELIKIQIKNNNDIIYENVSVVKKETVNNINDLNILLIYDNFLFRNYLLHNTWLNSEITNQVNHIFNIYNDTSFIRILTEKTKNHVLKYLPDTRGVSISGILIDKNTNKPIPNTNIFASVYGNKKQIHVYNTMKDGKFYFSLNDLYFLQNIYICSEYSGTHIPDIKINNDYETDFIKKFNIPFYISKRDKTVINEMFINQQITNINEPKVKIQDKVEDYLLKNSIKSSSNTIIDDYIKFNSLDDVFREIIPLVNVSNTKKNKKLKVYNSETGTYFNNPLILLDNIPIFRIDKLLKINPNLIKNIVVVNSKYYIGDYLAEGIISIQSKNNNFANISLSKYASFFKYTTLSPNTFPKFISYNNSEEKNSRKPNFRNCIYWNSQIKSNNEETKYSIYASDYCSEYKIIYRGITKNGKIIKTEKIIDIRK